MQMQCQPTERLQSFYDSKFPGDGQLSSVRRDRRIELGLSGKDSGKERRRQQQVATHTNAVMESALESVSGGVESGGGGGRIHLLSKPL